MLFKKGLVYNQCGDAQAGRQALKFFVYPAAVVCGLGEAGQIEDAFKVARVRKVLVLFAQVVDPVVVYLHDIRRGAAGQLSDQFILVAVPAAVLKLNFYIGVFLHVQLGRCDGGFVACLAAPPGKTQGDGLSFTARRRCGRRAARSGRRRAAAACKACDHKHKGKNKA